MKTLITVIAFSLCFCVISAIAQQQKFNVPEYSLEGAKKFVKYYVRNFSEKKWNRVDEKPVAKSDRPIQEKLVYHVDRNGDTKMDLARIENYISEFPKTGVFGDPIPACKQVVLSIDDNFDGIPDRFLIDGCRPGLGQADEIFDVEEPTTTSEKEYWRNHIN